MGIITDIQRFSLNDGAGIRTSVFLKGCNMACRWCHNPETINPRPQTLFYAENCIRCGECDKGCFADARVVSGAEMTADEVYAQIKRDYPYYIGSGGGVTLTGGEVLVQAAFAGEILKKCRQNGIHTAVESNLNAPWETIAPLLDLIDFVFADIKHIDPHEHKKYTGVSNQIILDNIKRLDQANVLFAVRTPVIPGVNDNEAVIAEIGAFLRELKNPAFYELLNFNPLGGNKYKALGLNNTFAAVKPLSAERMQRLAAAAGQYGIEMRCG